MTAARRALGAAGEQRAVEWYEAAGYRVLGRNWRYGRGELDVIALSFDAKTVVFCEVKTRTTAAFGTGLEAVTPAKASQVRKLAAAWLREHPDVRAKARFDVIGLTAGVLDVVIDAF